jgi:hypothetical protein
MVKEFKIEELLENLPDYINGRIENSELKNAINSEISSNSEFKKEFESLNNTFKSINNFSFTEPPDYYFNNLLPRINDRIYTASKSNNFKKSFSAIWKFGLPVTAVILMFIGYKTFYNNNEYIKNINSNSQIEITNDYQSKIKNDDSVVKNDTEVSTSETESANENGNFISNTTKSFYTKQNTYDRIINTEENNIIAIDITDNTPDDDVFFSNDEESNIEQEFEKLNSDEQNKILSEIKKF